MKPWCLLLILTLFAGQATTQTFEWAKGHGGDAIDRSYQVVSDEKGNHYFTGYFQSDTAFVGKDTLYSSNKGSFQRNLIVAEQDKGGKIKWTYTPEIKNNIGFCSGRDIVMNESSIFITGSYSDTVIFGKQDTLKGGNNTALFLLKMDVCWQ